MPKRPPALQRLLGQCHPALAGLTSRWNSLWSNGPARWTLLMLAGVALLAGAASWPGLGPNRGHRTPTPTLDLYAGRTMGVAQVRPGYLVGRRGEPPRTARPAAGPAFPLGEEGLAHDGPARVQASWRGGERVVVPPQPTPTRGPLRAIAYEVAPGDTIAGLAQRFGISPETIVWANDLLPPGAALQSGRSLTILPVTGVLYRVRPGDTLLAIALGHKADADGIVEANALTSPDHLSIGQVLIIPNGQPLPPPTPRPRPAPALPPAPPAAPLDPEDAAKGRGIVAIASRFLGYRYTWGGQTPSTGFDCSGFTWYVYQQAGLRVPRSLSGQLGAGPAVQRGELAPGDLVFFQNTYQAGLSHVGIYMGEGRFIHAVSEARGVDTDHLGAAFWDQRYLGASRPWR